MEDIDLRIKELEINKRTFKSEGFDLRYKADLLQEELMKIQQAYQQKLNEIGAAEREIQSLKKELNELKKQEKPIEEVKEK